MKEKPIMAQRIRELRKAQGLTQAQLAERAHLKETAIVVMKMDFVSQTPKLWPL